MDSCTDLVRSAGRPLTDATLADHAGRVAVPTYDRRALTPSVVHLGLGNFHRAHQAVFFDELAERRISTGWGIVGVSMRRRAMRDALAPQDCLFTVVERDADGDRARVIGALQRCLLAPEDPEAVLDALADPRTRLVTLTVTGEGYAVDPRTGVFDPDDPAIRHDLRDPSRPISAAGAIVAALERRRHAGVAPFTVLSCDNVPSNGRVARTSVVSLARLRDPELAAWISEHVAFPSSMVDRITPETTDADRINLARSFGIEDRWPVMTEPFSQWIVEDDFCNGRPPLEEVGVQFVDDVEPYERIKKRLLNAGHSALGYLGTLAGQVRTDDAIADPLLAAYLRRLMDDEVTPLLPEAPGIDLDEYKDTLLERLANPGIADPLARLCGRGSAKMPAYLVPSVAEALESNGRHELLTLALAAWMRYLRGVDDAGLPIEVKDLHAERLQRLARAGGDDPRRLLGERALFGDLGDDPRWVAALARLLGALSADGARATIAACLAADDAPVLA